MTWGASIAGVGSVLGAIDDIQLRLDDNAVYVVGSNVSYSVYVEMGTSRMDAQPYLFPAARKAQRQMGSIVAGAQSVSEAVKRVALFIEREAKILVPVDTGTLKASLRAERVR